VHAEAYAWLACHLAPYEDQSVRVLEYGSRSINGTPRPLLPHADWLGIDLTPGTDVDLVADAADWSTNNRYDLVLCTETFEHTEWWPTVCFKAYDHLEPDGLFLITCATDPRTPHSADDGHDLTRRESEYYSNIKPYALYDTLRDVGFTIVDLETHATRGDLYCAARRP
jgi:hypothetical protein